MKKKSAIILSLLLSVSLLAAACGGEKATTAGQAGSEKASTTAAGASAAATGKGILNEVGSYPIVKEPLKMKMFRLAMPNVIDYESNDFSKFLQEKTGIGWEFETAGQDAAEEAVNLAMTAGKDMPDVFLFATPSVAKYGVTEQMLLPIEDLIKDNMPNFMKFLEQKPELLAQITQTDGHIYGLPTINDCFHCKYRNKMWVNTKHLQELGMSVPKTTDEFMAVVKAYLAKYPNGIGVSGSIKGWGQQFADWLTNPFVLDPGTTGSSAAVGKMVLNNQSKKIESIATKDEYREALKFMSELYKAGGIYDGSFTQNAEQYRALMNQAGDPVLFAPYGTISDGYDVAERPESYADYEVMEPLVGPKGTQNATYFKYDGVAENKLVMTTNCKNPEAVLRWADHFYTMEGYLSMQFGADEGKDWVLKPEGEKGLNGEPALYKVLNVYSSQAQNHDWQDVGLNFATNEIRLGSATAQDVDVKGKGGLEKRLYDETKIKMEPFGQNEKSPYQVLPVLKRTSDEDNELQVVIKEVNDHIENSRTAFIRGTADVNDDKVWENYVQELNQKGLSRLLELSQVAYDRQFKGGN